MTLMKLLNMFKYACLRMCTNVFIVSHDSSSRKMLKIHCLPYLNGLQPTNFNKDKSCYSTFASPSKLSPGYLNTIWIGDLIIKRVRHARYLRFILITKFSIFHKYDFVAIIHEMGANWLLMKSSCALFVK